MTLKHPPRALSKDDFVCNETHAHFRDKTLAQKPVEGNPSFGGAQSLPELQIARISLAFQGYFARSLQGKIPERCGSPR
jgi:hypothetical protein